MYIIVLNWSRLDQGQQFQHFIIDRIAKFFVS